MWLGPNEKTLTKNSRPLGTRVATPVVPPLFNRENTSMVTLE